MFCCLIFVSLIGGVIARNFHADKPNEGTSPNSALVNEMLLKSVDKLKPDEKLILHTDRGCHYRWQSWIDITENFGFKRSMSAKGCSPNNSACELKNEFFYGRDWSDYSLEDFIAALDAYIVWYNEVRIKKSLSFLSPVQTKNGVGRLICPVFCPHPPLSQRIFKSDD